MRIEVGRCTNARAPPLAIWIDEGLAFTAAEAAALRSPPRDLLLLAWEVGRYTRSSVQRPVLGQLEAVHIHTVSLGTSHSTRQAGYPCLLGDEVSIISIVRGRRQGVSGYGAWVAVSVASTCSFPGLSEASRWSHRCAREGVGGGGEAGKARHHRSPFFLSYSSHPR